MSAGSNMDMKESTARWCVFPRLRRRFPSPSLVLMKGRDISLRKFQTRKIMGEKLIASAFTWHHICIILTRECPYDHSAVRSSNRAKLWWSDSIPDIQRPFPAPSSTKVVSMESVRHWISRVKDVALKVPFERPQE